LAAEDPRLADLQRGVIDKLQRVLPKVDVIYTARTRTGLFEGNNSSYGEVWYDLGGRREMTRSTTPPIVWKRCTTLPGSPRRSTQRMAIRGTQCPHRHAIFYGYSSLPGRCSVCWVPG
jgi:hypothetical protein